MGKETGRFSNLRSPQISLAKSIFHLSVQNTQSVLDAEMFGEDCFRDFRCDFLVVRLTIFLCINHPLQPAKEAPKKEAPKEKKPVSDKGPEV